MMDEDQSPPTEGSEKPPPPNLPNFQFSGTGHAPAEDPTSPLSGDEEETTNAQGSKAPAPAQKRRRVTRACDECRRKKIKCDGKQPCTHCTVYSYECTYDQPSNRKRNPTPQYIEGLETRLQRAETLLKTFLPNIDLNDPNLPTSLPQIPHSPKPATTSVNQPSKAPAKNGEAERDSLLESMVQDTGSLDLDDEGHWDFHGHSSGMVFLQRLRQQFGDMLGSVDGIGTMLAKPRYFTTTPNVFDSPKSSDSPLDFSGPVNVELPDKEHGYRLCELTMSDACSLMRFLHKPTFWKMFHKIYNTPFEMWGNEEHRYLPLLYALMAVGTMFAKDEDSMLQKEGYVAGLNDGFKWFRASRQLMDITDCRDIPSLQAIICMIMFLQSTAKLSTCWCYVGIALHSAIRMGLHRSIPGNFNQVELETRRRLFWQIRKMDLYVGAMIGLPTMLNEDDIDQDLPMDIDDEYITPEKILPAPPGYVHLMAGSNAQTRLLVVLRKVIKYVYPIKGIQYMEGKSRSYVVSHAKIREIERDLQRWMEELPMYLRPGGNVPPELARVQQLLRMAYAYVQMFLYRPFLHYVARANYQPAADKRSYACAAACVSVSRNVIHITQEMSRRGLLIGSFWFVMYTTFLAIMSLVFFALENPESKSSEEIMQDAVTGKDILTRLAKGSMAADRCTGTLRNLFDKLPERLKRGRNTSLSVSTKRKSLAVSPAPGSSRAGTSSPEMKAESKSNSLNSQRASTFPINTAVSASLNSSSTFPKSFSTKESYSNLLHQDNNAYTPQSSTATDINTPDTAQTTDSLAFSHFGLQPSTTTASASTTTFGLPDLSAMMFPTTDPFAYPNHQPMTTLEDNAFANGSPPGSSGTHSANGMSSPTANLFCPLGMSSRSANNSSGNVNGVSTVAGFDPAVEAQIFDPLQSYLNSGYQQGMGDMGLGPLGDMGGVSGVGASGIKAEEQPFGDWWAQSAGAQGNWTL